MVDWEPRSEYKVSIQGLKAKFTKFGAGGVNILSEQLHGGVVVRAIILESNSRTAVTERSANDAPSARLQLPFWGWRRRAL